jgi:hypothetical protein
MESRQVVRAFAVGLALAIAVSGCRSLPGPEETTDDGLVRVPSRKSGGVYRAPGAPFTQYTQFVVEPLTVEFVEGWRKRHKDTSDKEIRRMRAEAASLFLDEFKEILIEESGYTMADAPGPQVLSLIPAITEFDVPGPEVESVELRRMARPPSMTVTGELRDSMTGALVGRVIHIASPDRDGFNQLTVANRVTNAHEIRLIYAEWVRLLQEALNVAKTEQPREAAPATAEAPPPAPGS